MNELHTRLTKATKRERFPRDVFVGGAGGGWWWWFVLVMCVFVVLGTLPDSSPGMAVVISRLARGTQAHCYDTTERQVPRHGRAGELSQRGHFGRISQVLRH